VEEEGWDEEEVSSATARYGREDKIGLLLTMQSSVAANDPGPESPASFLDAARLPERARELNKHVEQAEGTTAASPGPGAADRAVPEHVSYQPPPAVERRLVGPCEPWRSFAPIGAATAWAWGCRGATRKAFGAANNGRRQRRFFASFVPMLDFIHALSYVFAAATAGRSLAAGGECYRPWIGWVWQGQGAQVLTAVESRQAELGLPGKEEAETSPRQVVTATLTYLRNHPEKMRSDAYRRQGRPLTSRLMESVVKQVNRRVKGTEKFWPGARRSCNGGPTCSATVSRGPNSGSAGKRRPRGRTATAAPADYKLCRAPRPLGAIGQRQAARDAYGSGGASGLSWPPWK
jgi:hypothetical protein